MARRLPRALARRSWWWLFGLFIATPAVALALLGLGAIRADERERQRQHHEQQTQVAAQIHRLADAALTTAIDRVATDTRRTLTTSPALPQDDDAVAFEIDARGTVTFSGTRLYVEADGASPEGASSALTPRTRAAIERAQAAELQGASREAAAWYDTLRPVPALRAWAEWRVMLQSDPTPAAMASYISTRGLMRSDARSPSGVPLAMVALSELADWSPEARAHVNPLASEALDSLVSGVWWTSASQRRVYLTELRRMRAGAQDDVPPVPEAAALARLEETARDIRRVFEAQQQRPPRVTVAGSGETRSLIAWTRPAVETDSWSGVALPGPTGRRLLDETLGPLADGQSFHLTLRHADDVIWSRATVKEATVAVSTAQPLSSAPGWTLTIDDTSMLPPARSHRLLNYARVIFPIVVLACGLVMTAWIVRRELALTALQSTFVSAVTHEFKSPLTSIRLLTERLASGRIPPDASPARYHAAIAAETDRLEGLVNRLLESQKLQSGQREYTFQPASLAAIAGEAIERMRPQAEAKDIHLDLAANGTVPALPLDVDAMADAVRNLIDNAIKYSPAHTRVVVSLAHDGQDVELAVTDEGIGVDPAEADKLFDPFYRSRRGDRANVHGTGLGLSLVRATAEAHGGRVTVTTNGNRGSRFTMRIPVTSAASEVLVPPATAHADDAALREASEGRF